MKSLSERCRVVKIKDNNNSNVNVSGVAGNIYSDFIICFGHCSNITIY